jgi:hypothetical protein
VIVGLVILLGVGVAGAATWAAWSLFRPNTGEQASAGPAPIDKGDQPQVYLSALDPIDREHWPMRPPPPPGRPPIRTLSGVRVRGKDSPHGIFMHPPHPGEGSAASVTYRLRGGFRSLHGEVSLNDGPPGSASPVTFAVYGDGRLLWESKPFSSQRDAQPCEVSVQGVDRLKLEVRAAGDAHGAHAVWVEPYLER